MPVDIIHSRHPAEQRAGKAWIWRLNGSYVVGRALNFVWGLRRPEEESIPLTEPVFEARMKV